MIRRLHSIALIALLAAACAGPRAAGPADGSDHHVDPVGTYDLIVDMNGMLISATLVIEGNVRDGWTGSIESDAGPASVDRIRVDGHTLSFSVPEAQARVTLHIDGREVHGEMGGGMGAAAITGEKR